MARRNKQRKQSPKSAPAVIPPPSRTDDKQPASQSVRETIESIVIAFVLAFLFRTFEAEAFVIPTGSMAPTLMGRHKDVFCTECDQRFQITASDEQRDDVRAMRSQHSPQADDFDCVAGICPNCRRTMPVVADLPPDLPEQQFDEKPKDKRSYAGDRILVNKYIYSFQDPQRWDVVVFKFPGRAEQNYIKRLVGLPGETLRIYQGDLFVTSPGDEAQEFSIARKPASKVVAMRQLVHDTDHDPVILFNAGWPLRWDATTDDGWEITRETHGELVRQRFASQPDADGTAWIRYQHFVPDYQTWLMAEGVEDVAFHDPPRLENPRPQLVTDFCAYNTQVSRKEMEMSRDMRGRPTLRGLRANQGVHWVGDLTLEADVKVATAEGQLLLDLVEGGRHFTCTFDLATGRAQLGIDGLSDFAPQAQTAVKGRGSHRLTLANVDDQLFVWVDGKLIEFDTPTTYDADTLFGRREQIRPQSTSDDPGDLAPAGVGTRNAAVAVDRLRIYRDIYYIATDWRIMRPGNPTDLPGLTGDVADDFFSDPSQWDAFLNRQRVEFPLEEGQFFVMGDNSAASLDSRLWRGQESLSHPGQPGGPYLERRLLIGKALCVYWPHSWYHIPGTPIPLFPNFGDMRLVR